MFHRIFLCLTAVVFLSLSVAIVSAADFSKLPISMEVSKMTASEDGKLLILSHRASSKLSVWHVESEKVIHTVSSQSPGSVLSRGNQTYVLNLGEGTISVFGHSNWELIDQLEAPTVSKAKLTAPQGDAFKGVMILSEVVDRYDTKLHVIDIQNDRFKEIGKAGPSGLTSSYSGKICLEQGAVGNSPSATIEVHGSFDQYLSGKKPSERLRGNHENTPLLHQVRNNEFWFGGNRIYRGIPPKPLGESLGRIVVPDRTRDLAYALSPQSLTCKALTGSMPEVGRTKVSFPKSLSRMGKKYSENKKRGETDRQHIAMTQGSSLHVFVYSEDGNVYRAKMNSFAAPGTVQSGVGVAQSEPATVAPSAASGGNSLLPNQVVLGKQLKFNVLPGDVTGEFSVVQGPEGAVIDNKGSFTWTPTNEHLGEQRIKIRAKLGSNVQFLRFNTFVVTRMGEGPTSIITATPGVTTAPSMFAKIPIAMQTSAMVITEDGKHLILSHSASDKITVWNIQDKAIEETIDCDSPGKMISRGNNTYIGSGGGKISVLNNSTWQFAAKKADVGVSEINGLTAPQGRYFKGVVIVTSHFDRNSGQYTIVDIPRNRAKLWHKIRDNALATSSYNGKYVITQASNAGQIDVHETFNDIAAGKKTRSPGRNGERCPLIKQIRNNEFWYGHKWVFRGVPPKRAGDERLEIVVGDRNHDVFYRLDEERINAYSLTDNFQEIGSAKVEFPRSFERMHKDLRKSHHNSNAGGYDRDHVAITVDNTLHLFLINGDAGDVYYRPMNAFIRTPKLQRSSGYTASKSKGPSTRVWKDTTGAFSITAKLIDVHEGNVVLQRPNGEDVTVPLQKLSESDRLYIKADPRMVAKENPDQPEGGTKPRKWTSKTGSTVVATFVSLAGGRVSLRRQDNGQEIAIPIAALSNTDIEFLRELERSEREGGAPAANVAAMPANVAAMPATVEPAPAKVEPAPATVEPARAKASMAPAEIAKANNSASGQPAQPVLIGEPLVKDGDPFPSIDGLDPELVAIAKGIESLTHENDEVKRLERRTQELIEQGKDMTLLLPHFSWGFQTSPNNLYKAYLYMAMRGIVELPGGEAVLPDLLIHSNKCLAENQTTPLYHTLFLLATLGHYDLIEPCLQHESVDVRESALNGVIALMTQNVTPSQRMMELVWKNTEHKSEQRMAKEICVVLGLQRPVDDRAFAYYEKCRERMLGHLEFLAAAYPASPKARNIWNGLMKSWDDSSLLDEKFEEAQKREEKRRSKKPGGVAISSGKVAP